jgi:trehalose 6-phosphate phosphatase
MPDREIAGTSRSTGPTPAPMAVGGAAASLAGIPRSLWRLAGLAPQRLLLLDYDGTLAPYRVERSRALPEPRARALLDRVAAAPRSAVAIVSGRPLHEVADLVGALDGVLVGEHGWESRTADGAVTSHAPDPAVRAVLERAAELVAAEGLGDRLERKRASVVLHTRGLPPDEARDVELLVRELWRREVLPGRVRLVDTNGGLELRAARWDKGKAVLALLEQSPPGTLAVYLGDDLTDEDAFHTVQDSGFGIRVGPEERPTLAAGRLGSPEDVAEFLERWLALLGSPSAAGGA